MMNTEYERRMHQEQMDKKKQEISDKIVALMTEEQKAQDKDILWYMNYVEKLIHACGGEQKLTFLDVSHGFIKAGTRVPLTANLYPFLQETDKDNPRFHKMVTSVLMKSSGIKAIRWMSMDRGAYIMITLKEDTK